MAVDLSLVSIIDIIAQSFFGGSSTLAGLVIMLAVFFVMIVILGNLKAPITYSLVPMMILAIVFTYVGVMDTTVSFMIIIVSVVLIAITTRDLTAKG